MSHYTFDELPGIVAMLADEIKALREQIQQKDSAPRQTEDGMMDLKGLQEFHPASPSPPAPNPSQHQGLYQSVSSLHEVAKVLEFQL